MAARLMDVDYCVLVVLTSGSPYVHLVEARHEMYTAALNLDPKRTQQVVPAPLLDEVTIADDNLQELVEEYAELSKVKNEAEKKLRNLKKAIREAMGQHKYLQAGPYTVVVEIRERRPYTVKGGTYEVMRVVREGASDD